VVVASSGELVAVAVAVAGSDGGPDGNESDMVLLWRGVSETTVGV
jgi:tellurite resistance protein